MSHSSINAQLVPLRVVEFWYRALLDPFGVVRLQQSLLPTWLHK